MINATELRVGNAVNYLIKDDLDERKEWYDTYYIDADDIKECVEDNEVFNKFHKPIPLTEEILLKCGFSEKNKWFFKGGIMLGYITTDENLQCEWNSGWDEPKWNLIDIKYLHQLQNLYFAMTGKELEINL